MVIAIDLQNVTALPQADMATFFCKKKINVYNLTAHSSWKKKRALLHLDQGSEWKNSGWCCFFHHCNFEKFVKDNPEANRIILWSDSCMTQNKNLVLSSAILKFFEKYPSIPSVGICTMGLIFYDTRSEQFAFINRESNEKSLEYTANRDWQGYCSGWMKGIHFMLFSYKREASWTIKWQEESWTSEVSPSAKWNNCPMHIQISSHSGEFSHSASSCLIF